MAHLLLIENWVRLVGGTSGMLPECIRRMGHCFTFVARNIDRYRSERDARGEPHPVLALADRVIQVDTNEISTLCEWASRAHASTPFDAVHTGCDFYLEAVAQVARHLGLPGNDPRAIRRAYHKHLMREAEERHGLPGPRTLATARLERAQAFARSCGFPIVVKPTDLGGSEMVRFVEDASALESAFSAVLADRANGRGQARMPIVLLEEFMPGEEVSVETFTVSGRTKVIGITDKTVSGKPAFIETMHMFPAQLTVTREREAVQAALATLAAIGYEGGLAHTEVKLTPAGARVVEVNARMAGNHIYRLIELTTGLNLFELGIRLALGEVLVEHELPAPRGSAAVAYLLPPGSGRIDAVEGLEALRENAGEGVQVCQVEIRRGAGDHAMLAGDNDDYIGHFIVQASRSSEARSVAEKLLGRVRVHMSLEPQ